MEVYLQKIRAKDLSILNGELSGKEIIKVLRELISGIHSRVEDAL